MLSQEAANDQLQVFIDYYDIDLSDLGDAGGVIKNRTIRHIMKGRLEITEDADGLKVSQILKGGDKITYSEIQGKHKITMGKKPDGDAHGKSYALMGALCGNGEAFILKQGGRDLSVIECLAALYMNV